MPSSRRFAPACAAGPDGHARAQRRPAHRAVLRCRPDGSTGRRAAAVARAGPAAAGPFEYYACDDATDFSAVPWDRAGERDAVDNLVTGNDIRARLVVNEWRAWRRSGAAAKRWCFAFRWRTRSS
jgi:hypothetical protein